ncbi:hypothetical protein SDC9_158868 [bioreactor metagenome]|uniref:Uncharacterized protein n=1 Tax=bioreactor metagenome TaxID=1076179 RepID=A0A645FB12_9ZZZZ
MITLRRNLFRLFRGTTLIALPIGRRIGDALHNTQIVRVHFKRNPAHAVVIILRPCVCIIIQNFNIAAVPHRFSVIGGNQISLDIPCRYAIVPQHHNGDAGIAHRGRALVFTHDIAYKAAVTVKCGIVIRIFQVALQNRQNIVFSVLIGDMRLPRNSRIADVRGQ